MKDSDDLDWYYCSGLKLSKCKINLCLEGHYNSCYIHICLRCWMPSFCQVNTSKFSKPPGLNWAIKKLIRGLKMKVLVQILLWRVFYLARITPIVDWILVVAKRTSCSHKFTTFYSDHVPLGPNISFSVQATILECPSRCNENQAKLVNFRQCCSTLNHRTLFPKTGNHQANKEITALFSQDSRPQLLWCKS